MARADLGVVGLAVMGRNLALNAESCGHSVAVFNRTAERTREFAASRAAGRRIVSAYSLVELVEALEPPRKILLMVKAGRATDDVLSELLPLLDRNDVVIDGGNAHYADTERRLALAESLGVRYLGTGISGGEYGALHGPSIMAGGSEEAYRAVESILVSIAARGPEGPCCAYFGPGSSGHYVKMVHNGIEYAMMQTLAETYDLMKRGLGLPPAEMADVFGEWNRGDLAGYLVEITEKILRRADPDTGSALVEAILDTAAQKGTGKWSSQSALDLGTPAPTIAAAVFARIVSSLKSERVAAERSLSGPAASAGGLGMEDLYGATLLTVVSAYGQGLRQLLDASAERGYGLNLAEVARVWTDGCIIRARLLDPIRAAFVREPDLPFLMLAEPFRTMWEDHQDGFRRAVVYAHQHGFPVPAIGSALNALDSYRTGRLPANLLQAQRDFFGAHTYQRVDRDGTFHTDWESTG
jgi:6-phosphogluconate dehydrogenase